MKKTQIRFIIHHRILRLRDETRLSNCMYTCILLSPKFGKSQTPEKICQPRPFYGTQENKVRWRLQSGNKKIPDQQSLHYLEHPLTTTPPNSVNFLRKDGMRKCSRLDGYTYNPVWNKSSQRVSCAS